MVSFSKWCVWGGDAEYGNDYVHDLTEFIYRNGVSADTKTAKQKVNQKTRKYLILISWTFLSEIEYSKV